MGKATTNQIRIYGSYSQKKGANMGRKLEDQRRRTQVGTKETIRKDDGKNKYKNASLL